MKCPHRLPPGLEDLSTKGPNIPDRPRRIIIIAAIVAAVGAALTWVLRSDQSKTKAENTPSISVPNRSEAVSRVMSGVNRDSSERVRAISRAQKILIIRDLLHQKLAGNALFENEHMRTLLGTGDSPTLSAYFVPEGTSIQYRFILSSSTLVLGWTPMDGDYESSPSLRVIDRGVDGRDLEAIYYTRNLGAIFYPSRRDEPVTSETPTADQVQDTYDEVLDIFLGMLQEEN